MTEAVEASEELIRLVQENAELANLGAGCDDETITAAERELGAELPPSYRRLVREFGSWDVNGAEFLGVYRTPALKEQLLGSVRETLDARRQHAMPSDLIAVMFDGMGNIIVLDSSQPDDSGEYPVLAWNSGVNERADMERLGDNFGTFALDMCQRAVRD